MADQHAFSKFLSYVLRHHPEAIGIELSADGFVEIDTLIAALTRHGRPTGRARLDHVVATSDKQRFAFSPDGTKIRANQGHSVEVDLGLRPVVPPDVLFHGTVERFLASIRLVGLAKGQRHHVHLSEARDVAKAVGSRRGRAQLLEVDAAGMAGAGHQFYKSDNGVWLTDRVPPSFITFPRAD